MIVVLLTAFVLLLVAGAFLVNRRTALCALSQPTSDIRGRLAAEMAQLELLRTERDRLGDPAYEKGAEDEIIWNELVELELQDIDEELARIRNSAGAE